MLKFGFKLLLVPVWLVVMVMKACVRLLLNVSEIAVGLIMMVYFVCIIITVCQKEWTQTCLVLVGAGVTFVIVMSATTVVYLLESTMNVVNEFMIS